MKQADIGLIGLAVMGENLVLNMESKGFTVAVYNRTVSKVDDFIQGRGAGKKFIGAHSIEELVASLERPRKVMMLVKASKDSEAGVMPSEALLGAMASFHEELVKAGITHQLTGRAPALGAFLPERSGRP